MEDFVRLFAVFGFIALLRRAGRAAVAVLRRGVDSFLSRETADVRARRGDLTGLAEAEETSRRARGARLRAGGALLFWLALLAIPPLIDMATTIYAVCAMLWLAPPLRLRGGRPGSAD